MSASDLSSAGLTPYTKALNLLPFAFLVAGISLTFVFTSATAKILCGLASVYLVPPLICRTVLALFGTPKGRNLTQDSRDYKIWWFLVQLQVLHNRFPALEEVLRLVPGLYAAWIWLWGGKVSPMAYWGPGSVVTDRYLLHVEKNAVIGTQAGLAGHMGTVDGDGFFHVDIAAPHVGKGAIVGARGGLGPGATLADHAMLPPSRRLAPFARWPRTSFEGRASQTARNAR